jgi:hypothetical protein
MFRYGAPTFSTCDTVDPIYSMALQSRNEVPEVPGFAGNDIDELSFDFIKTIPAYYTTFTWATTDVYGASKFSFNLTPNNFSTTTAYGATTVTNFTPMSFVARHFLHWRGGFVFTFKFVKTEFHSGRLDFVFIPADFTSGAPTYSIADNPYLFRTVVDIREGNEFTIRIPYVSIYPYLQLGGPSELDGIMGQFNCTVLTPLQAPNTVTTSIPVLIEVSADSDMTFQNPNTAMNFGPVFGVVAQSAYTPRTTRGDNTCRIAEVNIGSSSSCAKGEVFEEAIAGETVRSFRQLLKRYNGGGGIYQTDDDAYRVQPYAIPVAHIDSVTGIVTYPLWEFDTYTRLGSIFALSRGQVRFALIHRYSYTEETDNLVHKIQTMVYVEALNKNTPPTQDLIETISGPIPATTLQAMMGNSQQLILGEMQPVNILQIPAYNRVLSRANSDQLCVQQGNTTLTVQYNGATTPRIKLYVFPLHMPDIASSYQCYRFGADDCTFGCFVSIPPMINSYVPP